MSQSQGGNTSSSNTHTLNSSERDPHKNSWARMLLGMGMGCHNCYTKEKKSSDTQFLSHRFSCNPWWELYEEKQQQDFGLGMQQNALIMTTLCNRDIPKDIRQHHLLLVCDIEGWWHMQANWNESLSILWQTNEKNWLVPWENQSLQHTKGVGRAKMNDLLVKANTSYTRTLDRRRKKRVTPLMYHLLPF